MAKNLSDIANEYRAKQDKELIALIEDQRVTDEAIAIVKKVEHYKLAGKNPTHDGQLQFETAMFFAYHEMTPEEWLKNHVSD